MSNSFENSTLGNVLRSFLGLGSSASLEAVEFSRNLSGVLARNRAQGFVSLSTLYRDPLSGRQNVQSAYLLALKVDPSIEYRLINQGEFEEHLHDIWDSVNDPNYDKA